MIRLRRFILRGLGVFVVLLCGISCSQDSESNVESPELRELKSVASAFEPPRGSVVQQSRELDICEGSSREGPLVVLLVEPKEEGDPVDVQKIVLNYKSQGWELVKRSIPSDSAVIELRNTAGSGPLTLAIQGLGRGDGPPYSMTFRNDKPFDCTV
jgi:hypothetical protein